MSIKKNLFFLMKKEDNIEKKNIHIIENASKNTLITNLVGQIKQCTYFLLFIDF